MICPECNLRPVSTRGRCRACYERHRSRGRLSDLPSRYYKHTEADCPICDEVTTLTAYGWGAADIIAALHRNAEHVLRHLRQYQHPHAERFLPLATEATRTRKATA